MQTTTNCYLFLIPRVLVQSSGYASSTREQEQLSLIQQQLDTIERLATLAKTGSTAELNGRYRFDYLRLTEDIQRIHQGVKNYLSPSRAQPRDPAELVGDYRLDTPPEELSP